MNSIHIQKAEEREPFPIHFSEAGKDKVMSRKGNYQADFSRADMKFLRNY